MAAILVAQPVFATAYSIWKYGLSMDPHGSEPDTDYCARAGIIDNFVNQGAVRAYLNGGNDCVGTFNTLPSGWLAVKAFGFRDGSFCGETSMQWSNQATYSWAVWSDLCSNPSGSQEFRTYAWGNAYDGIGGEEVIGGLYSPNQNY